MGIVEQIKKNFNSGYFDMAMRIDGLAPAYPAWTVKQNEWIGVAVPMESFQPFSEQFSHVRIHSEENVLIDGVRFDLLMLTSADMETRNEFALVCSDFVSPGENGKLRFALTSDPASWWKNWKHLMGNVSSDQMVYDTLGELLTVERLLQDGHSTVWSGAEGASHDIETADCSIEVKTTNQRYGYEATINSIYQMVPVEGKPLYLSFIRVEPSIHGKSIDDVVNSLISLGYAAADLEEALERKKLEKGRPARAEKYKIIEWKRYPVNEKFPAITEESFKDNRLPEGIVRLRYTVDLSGLPGENLLES